MTFGPARGLYQSVRKVAGMISATCTVQENSGCERQLEKAYCAVKKARSCTVQTPAADLTIYRFYLLHEVLWAFLFDIAVFTFIPIAHLPHICYQSTGILKTVLGHYGNYCFLFIFTILCGGKAYAQWLCIFYRYILAYRHRAKYRMVLTYLARFELPWTPAFYCGVFLSGMLTFWALLRYFSGNPVATTATLRVVDPKVRELLVYFPQTTCMLQQTSSYEFVLLCGIFVLVGWGMLMAFLVLSLAYTLRTEKHSFSKTGRLQWMLFRSLVAQLSVTLVFLYFPILIWFLAGYFDSNYNMLIGLAACSFLAMHSTVDCVAILLYVRPFRQAIRNFFCNSTEVESFPKKSVT
ncbi:unnamed protein product [Bursaphelenchus xylophilus]|uniref:(pine wood nematode) hypothetical protein n=1 Tax=Bursaphelenchus xylophilus TaxID=6326 RepID=A0A1I7SCG9_BURXY|nr:unnamed protein product [Bursaphelenchus xylophilus]CAG9094116.1 unnamed protein product [Bursaphelenchus xylophilus]